MSGDSGTNFVDRAEPIPAESQIQLEFRHVLAGGIGGVIPPFPTSGATSAHLWCIRHFFLKFSFVHNLHDWAARIVHLEARGGLCTWQLMQPQGVQLEAGPTRGSFSSDLQFRALMRKNSHLYRRNVTAAPLGLGTPRHSHDLKRSNTPPRFLKRHQTSVTYLPLPRKH